MNIDKNGNLNGENSANGDETEDEDEDEGEQMTLRLKTPARDGSKEDEAGVEVLHGVRDADPGTVVVDLWNYSQTDPINVGLQIPQDQARGLGVRLIEAALKEREREIRETIIASSGEDGRD